MSTNCPQCGYAIVNDGSLAGRLVACPTCHSQFLMPNRERPSRGTLPQFLPVALGLIGACLIFVGCFLPVFATNRIDAENLLGIEPLLGGGLMLAAFLAFLVACSGGHYWQLMCGPLALGLTVISFVVVGSRIRAALDATGRNLLVLQPQYGWAILVIGCAAILAVPFVYPRCYR